MKIIENMPRPFFEASYFFFAALLTMIYTYPLIINLNRMFYGLPWDPLAGIWSLWWFKFSYINELQLRVFTYLAYPFGLDFSNSPFSYIVNLAGFLLAYFTNEIAAYNFLKMLSFPLLALTTYYLIYYLTEERIISAVIGLVYAFSPFHVIHNMAHFASLYWAPLAVLFLVKILRDGGYKNGALFGLFFGISFVEYAYYTYFIGILMPVFIIAYLSNSSTRTNIISTKFLKVSVVSFIVFCLIIFPMLYPMLKGIFWVKGSTDIVMGALAKDFSDLFIFSAKPLDYLFP